MLLLTGFAIAALLLAGVGIYGTVSQSVVQRTQEIGLRMALGASPGAALRLVFQQGILLAGAGIAAGSLAAVGLTQLMRKMLFEVHPLDPVSFVAAAVALGAFAALACYVPGHAGGSVGGASAGLLSGRSGKDDRFFGRLSAGFRGPMNGSEIDFEASGAVLCC